MKMNSNIRIAFSALILVFLLTQGVPPVFVAFLGILFATIFLFKDYLWKRIEKFLDSKNVPKEPAWLRWLIVFALFFIAYYAVKLVLFYLLGAAGFDFQAELVKSMNVTQ